MNPLRPLRLDVSGFYRMLDFVVCDIRCRVSLLFPALMTALLLCQRDTIIVVSLLASVIHEGGHLLAMLLCRVQPTECILGLFGMRIHLPNHLRSYRQNVWIALAGPLANVLSAGVLALFSMPVAVAVHLWLAALNLLPVTVLDGGEILRCVLLGYGKEADTWLRWTSALIIVPVTLLGVWMALEHRGGITILIVGVYLAAMVFLLDKNEKNS